MSQSEFSQLSQLLQDQYLRHKNTGVSMTCPAIRFSGEMNTSLGNSITNLASIQVACRALGYEPRVIVEGDDALFTAPENIDQESIRAIMRSMGFNIKIDTYENPGSAGFCGLYWQDGEHVVNFLSSLPDLYWCQKQTLINCTRSDLLAAKLNSLAAADDSLPGIWPHFKNCSARCMLNQYEAETMNAIPMKKNYVINTVQGREPTMKHRLAYYQVLGIPLHVQLQAERMPLHEAIDLLMQFSPVCQTTEKEYYDRVMEV